MSCTILAQYTLRCPSKTCFLENTKIQPISVVFGGWFASQHFLTRITTRSSDNATTLECTSYFILFVFKKNESKWLLWMSTLLSSLSTQLFIELAIRVDWFGGFGEIFFDFFGLQETVNRNSYMTPGPYRYSLAQPAILPPAQQMRGTSKMGSFNLSFSEIIFDK